MNVLILSKRYLLVLLFFVVITNVNANITLPSIFGDHMVMPQNTDMKIWGWGKPMEKIKITNSWSKDTVVTEVDHNGNWSAMIKTTKAGGPHELVLEEMNKVVINDILMGDVWLFSGQSNMEWSARHGFINSKEEQSNANYPQLRLFHVTWRTSPTKCLDLVGKWEVCTPESMYEFSAIAYFCGREIHNKLQIPVGVISSNWGGTPVETWMPAETIHNSERFTRSFKKVPFFPWAPSDPGYTYNAMIEPMMPFAIKGAVWYQGEANVDNPETYAEMLAVMVKEWRNRFGSDFDFYYAQIAPYKDYLNTSGVKIREQERRALKLIPKSSMVVLSDIGDTTDIHPRKKIEAGERFGQIALNKTYGFKEYGESGPLFKEVTYNGSKATVSFDYAEGLYFKNKKVKFFELSGEEGVWYPAKGKIVNDQVVLSSKNVKKPINVRFAWFNSASPGLMNKQGLPASCFNTRKDME